MKHSAAHRIEKRLSEFRLLVFGKQSDVVLFYLLPDCIFLRVRIETTAQVFFAFGNAFVVERNPFTRYALKFLPVSCLEQCLGMTAGLTKQAVMPVESIKHPLRDQVGKFGLRCCCNGSHIRSRSISFNVGE